MIFRSPCKGCLVQPCCKTPCSEQEEFLKFSHVIFPKVCFGFSILVIVSLLFLLINNIDNTIILLLLLLCIWLISFKTNMVLLEMQIEEMRFDSNFLDYMALFCISPFTAVALILLFLYQKFTKIKPKILP